MLTALGFILVGFILLIGGAEYLVRGSVALADKLKIPSLIVGLTVVALGTSTPEFVVSVKAALNSSGGISLGNVIGSNIANILLILGVTSLICPIITKREEFLGDYKFLFLATAVFVAFALTGKFVLWQGVVMILMLIGYVYYNYYNAKKSNVVEELDNPMAGKGWIAIILTTLAGLVAIVYGADLLVKGAIDIARILNVSEDIIGLTIVAVGTSLPELATTVMAAIRKQNDVALGNVVGSNIWNIVFIMGFTSCVTEVDVSAQLRYFDVWVMLGSTIILLPSILTGNKINRFEGGIFVLLYTAYIIAQIMISKGMIVF
jgi:cation:H+ antiporter